MTNRVTEIELLDTYGKHIVLYCIVSIVLYCILYCEHKNAIRYLRP